MDEISKEAQDALFDIYYEVSDLEELDSSVDENPLFTQLASLSSRYQDPSLVATGGMKQIFKMMDLKTNRYVAMAMLHKDSPDVLYDPFIREARLTALLEHPNIINIHDIGVNEEKLPYFTMDLKVGDSLSTIISKVQQGEALYKERYSQNVLLDIFIKVCDAIAYAHSRQILHLDLKPENIQIGEFGEVLVCDWGLGKIINDDSKEVDHILLNPDLLNHMTMHGKIKGTPGYMAPEQVTGDEKTKKTDIYSLGALLYSVLTQQTAFDGDTHTVLENTRNGMLLEPIKRDPALATSLNAIIMKAMQLKPDNRYDSVNDLRQDVYQYLAGFSPTAENAGLLTEVSLFYKRNKRSCNLIVTFMMVLVATVSIFVKQLHASRDDLRASRDDLQVSRDQTQKHFEDLQNSNKRRDLAIHTATPLAITESQQLYNNVKFQSAYDKLLVVYREGINTSRYWTLKADLEFGQLNFAEALKSYSHVTPKDGEYHYKRAQALIEIGRRYTAKKPTLPDVEKILSLPTIQKERSLRIHIYETINKTWQMTSEEQIAFIKRGLLRENPRVQILNFKYEIHNNAFKIDLSHNQRIDHLGAIRGLDISELNLANTNFHHQFYLVDYKFTKLNLSNTHNADIVFNRNLPDLEELIIKGMYIHSLHIMSDKLKTVDLSSSRLAEEGVQIMYAEAVNLSNTILKEWHFLRKIRNLKQVIVAKEQVVPPDVLKYLANPDKGKTPIKLLRK
jgi:serine/threonine protein kinase